MSHFHEIWHYGFKAAGANAWEGKKTSKIIANGLSQIAKIEQTYSQSLQDLLLTFKLPDSQDGTSLHTAWYSLLAGYSSIGNEHDKIAENFKAESEKMHQMRHNFGIEKREIISRGEKTQKKIKQQWLEMEKSKSSYEKAIRNYESAIQKKDEALVEDRAQQTNNLIKKLKAKVASTLDLFLKTRASYLSSVQVLQSYQLKFRDELIDIMNKFEDLEMKRFQMFQEAMTSVLSFSKKENMKVIEVIDAMEKYVEKVDCEEDISLFVLKNKTEQQLPEIASFKPAESNMVLVNLPSRLEDPPSTPEFPDGFEIIEYYSTKPKRSVSSSASSSTTTHSESADTIPSLAVKDQTNRKSFGKSLLAFNPFRKRDKSGHNSNATSNDSSMRVTSAEAMPMSIDEFLSPNLNMASTSKKKDMALDVITEGIVTALFDFPGLEEGELPLKAGDMIDIISRDDPDWWQGTLNGKTGEFPSSYVQFGEVNADLLGDHDAGAGAEASNIRMSDVSSNMMVSMGEEKQKAVALFDYCPEDDSDLSFLTSEMLWVQTTNDENWYYATNDSGSSGMIPSNYVEIQEENIITTTSTSAHTAKENII